MSSASARGLSALLALLLLATAAHAATVTFDLKTADYDSGWQVTAPDRYSLTIGNYSHGTDGQGRRWMALDISKRFIFPPDPQTGNFPPISLIFTQKAGMADADTANLFYIGEEEIHNGTGVAWDDFHWLLLRHGDAFFDEAATNVTTSTDPSVVGWQIAPFGGFNWTTNTDLDTQELSVFNGHIPIGGAYFPGDGLGNLVVGVNLAAVEPPATFTLKQYPTLPEPATMAVLALGAVALLRRRRT